MSVMQVGSHGSTFGGNPLAGVVAKASIKYTLDYSFQKIQKILVKF